MVCNQTHVTRGEVFFVYKCYDCTCFMPRLEVTSGSGIWNIQRPYGVVVAYVHCFDIVYLIKNDVSNGCWIQAKIHPIVVTRGQSKQGWCVIAAHV
jgi:hypothetical protein